jgi:hypothetical protein
MCCLKRPFDDQTRPRIRLESEAALVLLALEPEKLTFIRSAALMLENAANPVKERAARVDEWLGTAIAIPLDADLVKRRTEELIGLGIKNFDALHVACAELSSADCFVTCDDRLLVLLDRNKGKINVRAAGLSKFAQEVLK